MVQSLQMLTRMENLRTMDCAAACSAATRTAERRPIVHGSPTKNNATPKQAAGTGSIFHTLRTEWMVAPACLLC